MKFFMYWLLAVAVLCPSVVEAQNQKPGAVWRATRPETDQKDVGDVISPCKKEKDILKALVCVEQELVGVDTTNANAREQMLVDIDWLIKSFADHLDEYDHAALSKLVPHVDKLIELITKGGGSGMTDDERKTLAALVSSRDYLSRLLADHDERISKLEKEERGALTAHAGAYFFPYDVVVGGTVCAEFTFAQGVVGLQGCAGAGATVNDGAGVILVEAALKFRVIEPLHLNLGYLYSRRPGSHELEGADWVVSTGTLGVSVRVVKWLEMGGAAGVGECDFRDRVGKATCFDGKAYLEFRLPLL